jgi:hypothetical protein
LYGVFSVRFFVSEFVDVFLAHLEITQFQANFILLGSILRHWKSRGRMDHSRPCPCRKSNPNIVMV